MITRKTASQWIVAVLAASLAVGLAILLVVFVTAPGLGDGVHRFHPASLLILLAPVSYGLVAALAVILPERDQITVIGPLSFLPLLPVIFMGLVIHPVAGLIVSAALGAPLLCLWVLVYRLAKPRT